MMTASFLCFVSICVIGLVSGLYEDQVGDSDWQQQYLGHVTWLSFDTLTGGRKKVLMASESGVLAAVNAASGRIAWRQLLEKDGLFGVAHYRTNLVTVSGNINLILRSWDIETGLLKWEVPTALPSPETNHPLDCQWKENGGVLLELAGTRKDQIVLISNNVMGIYSIRSGRQQWNTTLPSIGVPLMVIHDSTVARIWIFNNSQVNFIQYNLTNGEAPPTESHVLSTGGVITQCVLFGTSEGSSFLPLCKPGSDEFIMVDIERDEYRSLNFKDNNVSPITTLRHGPSNHVHINSDVYYLSDDGTTLQRLCSRCSMEEVTSEKKNKVAMVVRSNEELEVVTIQNMADGSELEFPGFYNDVDIAMVKILLFYKSDNTLHWRVCVIRKDASVSLLSQNGGVVWTRHDGLGTITALEMVDLPSAQFNSEAFFSLLDPTVNPFTQAITRWRLQASLFQDTIKDVIDKGVASLVQPVSSDELLRDNFNIRKVIVVVTAHNKVYALDSNDGKILWELYLPLLAPLQYDSYTKTQPYLLYTLRTTSHPPYPPLMLLMGGNSECSNGTGLYPFNPITGQLLDDTIDQSHCLPRRIVQSMLLPSHDHTHQRVMVYIDAEGVVGCYPIGCGGIRLQDLNLFMYIISPSTGAIKGYRISEENMAAVDVWQMVLPSNERILTTANKHNDDVHSLGRVRANRDVQYKYLNPNILSVVTKSSEVSSTKSSLTVYLIDVVSGGLIHRSIHRQTSDPVGLVLCDNWIIYHYFNVKSQRNEITVVELYDPRNSTESVWSSLAPPTLPIVTSQSYVFSSSVVAMTITTTHKGITPRSILFGLPTGHVLSMRKDIFDPRREILPTQQMSEEGVQPYVPTIPLHPQAYINYNQTIGWLKGIHTSPTGLESTSLVFSYGLDLYSTRVQPSGQFDLIAEDFDYLLIAGVVLALVVATIALSWVSKRKTLNSLWK